MSDTYELLGRELKKEYSDEIADFQYVLYQRSKMRGQVEVHYTPMFRKAHTETEYGDWSEFNSAVARGNLAWAKRIAKQYNLVVPS